ncbi:MAG: response regulator, partial [Oscillospiraceae bacterium]|nr:response regulator [Oscillospiraceae bacterium]
MNETDKAEVTRKKIVLVDDLKFHLLSTKERLKDSYEVYTAQSADILFEILSKTPIDLILLDINMPDVDGYKVITQLKSTPRLKEIPVVFLSAKADKESVAKGLSLGAVDYVIKPFTDAALVDCIERQLNPKAKVHEKPIVLAVDDNPSILQSINHALDAQFKVYTLPQPEILEELLERLTPDLFL